MSDFVYRLAYVVICCAGMLGLWFAVRYGVGKMSGEFAAGFGVGGCLGVLMMVIANAVDKRRGQRPSRKD